MAIKYYGYYLKGNKLAVAQRDTDDTSSNEYGRYKSPTESVVNGLEIEYTYSPLYSLIPGTCDLFAGDWGTDSTVGPMFGYFSHSGKLAFFHPKGAGARTDMTARFTAGDRVVIANSNRWNGVHTVDSSDIHGFLVLKTPYQSNDAMSFKDGDVVAATATFDDDNRDEIAFAFPDTDKTYYWALERSGSNGSVYEGTSNGSNTLTATYEINFEYSTDNKSYSRVSIASGDQDSPADETNVQYGLYKLEKDNCQIYTHDVVSYLEDENFELDLTSYQSKAIVYYVKAKMAEDARDVEGREYFMRLFKKQLEKERGARKRGPYIAMGNSTMRTY